MISGVHAIVFSPAPAEIRAFFRDVLALPSVDAGEGWPIFALPPAELAIHPADEHRQELYLMTDDLDATVEALQAKDIALARPISEQAWGRLTAIALPGGTELALYEPAHPSPIVRPDRSPTGTTQGQAVQER